MNFGQRLKLFINNIYVSQANYCELFGMNKNVLNRYNTDKTQPGFTDSFDSENYSVSDMFQIAYLLKTVSSSLFNILTGFNHSTLSFSACCLNSLNGNISYYRKRFHRISMKLIKIKSMICRINQSKSKAVFQGNLPSIIFSKGGLMPCLFESKEPEKKTDPLCRQRIGCS